jgi:hypothetical protein
VTVRSVKPARTQRHDMLGILPARPSGQERVNRSLGAQIATRIRGLPIGTCVISVTIC